MWHRGPWSSFWMVDASMAKSSLEGLEIESEENASCGGESAVAFAMIWYVWLFPIQISDQCVNRVVRERCCSRIGDNHWRVCFASSACTGCGKNIIRRLDKMRDRLYSHRYVRRIQSTLRVLWTESLIRPREAFMKAVNTAGALRKTLQSIGFGNWHSYEYRHLAA